MWLHKGPCACVHECLVCVGVWRGFRSCLKFPAAASFCDEKGISWTDCFVFRGGSEHTRPSVSFFDFSERERAMSHLTQRLSCNFSTYRKSWGYPCLRSEALSWTSYSQNCHNAVTIWNHKTFKRPHYPSYKLNLELIRNKKHQLSLNGQVWPVVYACEC